DTTLYRSPFAVHTPARHAADPPHTVVGGQAQLLAFFGFQADHRLVGGVEKAFRAAGMVDPVDARQKRRAQQLPHLARALRGVHPGIGGHAGVGGADRLAPPVVVQLVDAVDEDEARLGEVVGGDHDHVPQVTGLHATVHAAGDHAVLAHDVVVVDRPVAPDDLLG